MEVDKEDIVAGSFAAGIRNFNTRGSLVIKTRLTKRRARILLDFVNEYKYHWNTTHPPSDPVIADEEHEMQSAMQWIINQVSSRWSQAELYRDESSKKVHADA